MDDPCEDFRRWLYRQFTAQQIGVYLDPNCWFLKQPGAPWRMNALNYDDASKYADKYVRAIYMLLHLRSIGQWHDWALIAMQSRWEDYTPTEELFHHYMKRHGIRVVTEWLHASYIERSARAAQLVRRA